jgi:hypothetical protein
MAGHKYHLLMMMSPKAIKATAPLMKKYRKLPDVSMESLVKGSPFQVSVAEVFQVFSSQEQIRIGGQEMPSLRPGSVLSRSSHLAEP